MATEGAATRLTERVAPCLDVLAEDDALAGVRYAAGRAWLNVTVGGSACEVGTCVVRACVRWSEFCRWPRSRQVTVCLYYYYIFTCLSNQRCSHPSCPAAGSRSQTRP